MSNLQNPNKHLLQAFRFKKLQEFQRDYRSLTKKIIETREKLEKPRSTSRCLKSTSFLSEGNEWDKRKLAYIISTLSLSYEKKIPQGLKCRSRRAPWNAWWPPWTSWSKSLKSLNLATVYRVQDSFQRCYFKSEHNSSSRERAISFSHL